MLAWSSESLLLVLKAVLMQRQQWQSTTGINGLCFALIISAQDFPSVKLPSNGPGLWMSFAGTLAGTSAQTALRRNSWWAFHVGESVSDVSYWTYFEGQATALILQKQKAPKSQQLQRKVFVENWLEVVNPALYRRIPITQYKALLLINKSN